MKNIAILTGGYSTERNISLNTAKQIYQELDKTQFNVYKIYVNLNGLYLVSEQGEEFKVDLNDFSVIINQRKINFDYVINALHGTPGEDGKIQGLLDILNIPYSSSGVFTSSLTFDKIATKKILSNSDIVTAKMHIHKKGEKVDLSEIMKNIGLPCFVKPNKAGSSYGISKVYEESKLISAINKAYKEDSTVIIEEFIDGIEVSCGLLKTKNKKYVFPLTEIDTKNDYFDTEAKYDEKITDEITPARISEKNSKLVQDISLKIYEEFNCKGIVRIDFIIKNDIAYFLELNTIPGMSAASIVPKQIKTVGLSIGKVFEEIIKDDI